MPPVPRRVLLVRPGAFGDALVTLPLLAALLDEGAERIDVLGRPASWRFLRHDPALAVHDIDGRGWLGLFADGVPLSDAAAGTVAGAGLVVLALGDAAPGVAARLAAHGKGRIVVVAPPRLAERATGEGIRHHAAARLLLPVVPEAGRDLERRLETARAAAWLRPDAREAASAARWLAAHAPGGGPLLAVHPGAGSAAKCWPPDHFAALIARAAAVHGLRPLLLVGPADRGRAAAVAGLLPSGLVPTIAEHGPRATAALLARAALFVGNDSGPAHLAARLVPSLVLFGPTDPDLWRPLGRRVAVVRAPGGDLGALTVETVAAALDRLAGAVPPKPDP